jgi:hypothetical protein
MGHRKVSVSRGRQYNRLASAVALICSHLCSGNAGETTRIFELVFARS